MAKQSLKQAVKAVKTGRFLLRAGLSGCPEGNWGETRQAFARLDSDLPLERSYTTREFVEAVYELDHAGRYQVRPEMS